jgi:hypothetical protein
MWRFYWEWLKRGLAPSIKGLRWLQWASGVLTLILVNAPFDLKERFPVLAHLPPWLADSLLIGPYVVFAGLLAYNFVAAPYLIFSIFREKVAELDVLRKREEPQKIKSELAKFYSLMEGLSKNCLQYEPPDGQLNATAESLVSESERYIFETLAPHYSVMYKSDVGLPDATLAFSDAAWPTVYRRKLYKHLSARMERLKELLARNGF